MRGMAYLALVVSAISLATAFISKLRLTPVAFLPGGLEAEPLLIFANTCLLVAIIFILLEMPGAKK
jgi:hypothetical protein